MERYYYSAEKGGFFLYSFKEIYEDSANGWPKDVVEITDEQYKNLLNGQAQGKIITADSKGYPVLVDPPPPTQEQLSVAAEAERKTLLAEATVEMAPLLDAVDLDEATEEEKNKLAAWKKYRVLLNRVDISKAPDIVWPEKP